MRWLPANEDNPKELGSRGRAKQRHWGRRNQDGRAVCGVIQTINVHKHRDSPILTIRECKGGCWAWLCELGMVPISASLSVRGTAALVKLVAFGKTHQVSMAVHSADSSKFSWHAQVTRQLNVKFQARAEECLLTNKTRVRHQILAIPAA